MWLEFSSKILGGSFLSCSLGSWLLFSVKGVYKMVGVLLFNFPLDGSVFCMPKYTPFLPKLAGDFLHHRNTKGKAAQCIYTVCIWQSSKALVCLGGDRKLFLPLKRYSTAQVMLNTIVFWITGTTQVILAACVRMLSPFPGYVIWKDYVLRAIFHIDVFPDCLYLYQASSMSDYCSYSASQRILRSDLYMRVLF